MSECDRAFDPRLLGFGFPFFFFWLCFCLARFCCVPIAVHGLAERGSTASATLDHD